LIYTFIRPFNSIVCHGHPATLIRPNGDADVEEIRKSYSNV